MMPCKMINQAGKPIPKQCEECRLLSDCVALNCLKEKDCSSRIPQQDPDLLEQLKVSF